MSFWMHVRPSPTNAGPFGRESVVELTATCSHVINCRIASWAPITMAEAQRLAEWWSNGNKQWLYTIVDKDFRLQKTFGFEL